VGIDSSDHSADPGNGHVDQPASDHFGHAVSDRADHPVSDRADHSASDRAYHPASVQFDYAASKLHNCSFHEEVGFAAEIHAAVDNFAIVVVALNRNFLSQISNAGSLSLILLLVQLFGLASWLQSDPDA
jgi:hypothetical protein